MSNESQTITDHRIQNSKSFIEDVTGKPREVAGLYFFSTLDSLVDLAYQVSHDFFQRPHLYIKVGSANCEDINDTLAPILAKLHARYGTDEKVLGKAQRDEIYCALFGKYGENSTEEEGNFPRLRDELVKACAAFSENAFNTNAEILRERVRTTHRPFYEYLKGLRGDSVRWSREVALSVLTKDISYPILRSERVAIVYGIPAAPKPDWPYAEDFNGDKLVEEISDRYTTREHFSNLQRTALRGAEAIATIIDFGDKVQKGDEITDEDFKLLITKCYNWGSALMSLRNYSMEDKVAGDSP